MKPGQLKVALVAGEDPGWGGIGSYTGILASGLRDLGLQVHLVLRGWEEDCRSVEDGVVVHRVTVPEPSWRRGTEAVVSRLYVARESLVFSARVGRLLSRLAREEGVAVVETPEFHAPGIVAALRARLSARPPAVVVRMHTPSYLTTRMDDEARTHDVRACELLELASARAAAVVTSPSAALAAEVARRWRIDRERIVVVPNPVDAELFEPGGEPEDRDTILVAGRIEPRKGQHVLVEALPAIRRAVPGARVRLVGADGDERDGVSPVQRLRRRIAELGVEADALLVDPPRPRADLPSVYRSAAVCAVPSSFDNFPYTCLEAMACGRPVVATNAGGPAEMIDSGRDGVLIPADRPAALAQAVVELLHDPARRRRLGEAARAKVLQSFSTPSVAARMERIYSDAGKAREASARG